MKRCFFTLLAVILAAAPAHAHFVWIAPHGNNSAHIVFSDDTDPEAVPITKIAQTKVYLRGDDKLPLKMSQEKAAYLVTVPAGKTVTIGGSCYYGVLEKGSDDPFLLVYHAQAVLGPAPDELRQQAKTTWEKLPLQILLHTDAGAAGKLRGQVIWQGKPIDSEVIALVPGQKRVKTNTNQRGEFSLPAPTESGLVAIRARFIQKKSGKLQDKEFTEARHYTTLTIPANAFTSPTVVADDPLKEDPAATKLLKEARQARSTWDKFPGFTAKLVVNHNGKLTRGTVAIHATGQIDLNGFDAADTKMFVRRQLSSLVMHRVSRAAERDTPCAFVDDKIHHPMGRKITVLNDELHSSYRIRDRQITEVNRQMKDGSRFTISVLKSFETPQKEFLPSSYVVNTWNARNQLVNSVSHFNTWKRVGEFYLPELVMIVTASDGAPAASVRAEDRAPANEANPTLDAWTFTFSDVQLMKR